MALQKNLLGISDADEGMMRGRWLVVSSILFLSLRGLLAASPAVAQPDRISGLVSAELAQEPGFEGLYRYRIEIYWSLAPDSPSDLFWFVDLFAYQNSCSPSDPVFAKPAGTADGAGPCKVPYDGFFLCRQDPAMPPAFQGGSAVYKPDTRLCRVRQRGMGVFTFYSPIDPAPPTMHRNALAYSDGSVLLAYGDLFGSLPKESVDPLPPRLVINEFLVRPPTGDREFIELLNVTSGGMSLTGWTLSVHQRGLTAQYVFGPSTIPPNGYRIVDSGFTISCPICFTAPERIDGGLEPKASGEFLFDPGGVIILRDPSGAIVDQVGYGNLGGAPISCPRLVVPSGAAFGPMSRERAAAAPETVATSTSRVPNGNDTGLDAPDFNVGPPTPAAANQAAAPDLGSSVRLDRIYAYPMNGDPDPTNEGLRLFNPGGDVVDVGSWHLSDGFLIRPMFAAGSHAPIEGHQPYSVFQGSNGVVSFELEWDDRLDLYDLRGDTLVRVDQLGWMRDPPFFPDSCFVRVPDGTGPANGWDWNTSGGFVNLFYLQGCGLEAPRTPVEELPSSASGLSAPWPNPLRQGLATIAFCVDASAAGKPLRLVVHDVSGRRVRELAHRSFPSGRYVAQWDGLDENGARAESGVYFVRLDVEGSSLRWTRTLVRLTP